MSPGAVSSLPPCPALSLSRSRCRGDAAGAPHVEGLARSPRAAQPRRARAGEAAALGPDPTPSRGGWDEGGSGPGLPRQQQEQGGAAGRCQSTDLPRGGREGGAAPAPGAPRSGPVLGRAEQRLRLRGERSGAGAFRHPHRDIWIKTRLPPPSRPSARLAAGELGLSGPGRAFRKRGDGRLAPCVYLHCNATL